VGYQQRGTGPARPQELVDAFPAERSESMTAIGLLLRARAGERAAASASMRSGIERCLALLPVWSPSDGRIDMYYWHHATEALKVAGGAAWRDWRTRLVSVAQSSQRKDGAYGTYRGSWDAIDPWGVDGGRVYSTSMMTLCLEASKE
jgi:hypothetical protein